MIILRSEAVHLEMERIDNQAADSLVCDGFICLPATSIPTAARLAGSLSTFGWNILHQTIELGLSGPEQSYLDNAENAIRNSSFSIVLIEPRGMSRDESDSTPSQQLELQKIMQRVKDAPQTESGAEYQVFFVAMSGTDVNDPDTGLTIDRALAMVADASGVPKLTQHKTTYELKCLGGISGPMLLSEIRGLAQKIDTACLHESLVPMCQSNAASEPNSAVMDSTASEEETEPFSAAPPEAAGNQTDIDMDRVEANYIRRATKNWTMGVIDRRDQHQQQNLGIISGVDDESPFFFNPLRFLVLNARHDGVMEMGSTSSQDGVCVFEYLLQRTDRPVMLVGGPGSGKSTTLATTAALLANQIDPRSLRRAKFMSKIEGTLSESARTRRGEGFFPVALRATSVFQKNGEISEQENLVLAAVADEVFAASSDIILPRAKRLQLIAERMRERPYAILVDGLDELFDELKVHDLLSQSEQICDDYLAERDGVKIVLCNRSATNYDRSGYINVIGINSPTQLQIQNFFKDYAMSRGQDAADFETRVLQFSALNFALGAKDLFQTPLLLNSFCWYISQHREFQGTQKELLDNVIDHLLTPNQKKRAAADFDYSPEQLRHFLRIMAYKRLETNQENDWISFQLCARAFNEGSWNVGKSDIDDASVERILQFLTVHTGLITQDKFGRESSFKFTVPLFCEILAGEWVFENGLVQSVLENINSLSDLKMWDRSLSVTVDALVANGQREKALEILNTILDLAEIQYEGINLNEWLFAIQLILARQTRYSIAEEESRTSPLQPIFERIGAFVQRKRNELDAFSLNRAVTNFLKMGLRTGPNYSQKACGNLYRCMGFDFNLTDGNWTSLASIGLSDLSVAKLPVLSCQFMEFVRECDAAGKDQKFEELWEHAPPDFAGIRIDDAELLRGSPWVNRTVDVWLQLEDNPASPMIYVNWFEAVAYARWSTRKAIKTGKIGSDDILRLPTNEDWSAMRDAVSGGKLYPWESHKPDTQAGNWRETRIGSVTVPGVFPVGSALDVFDFGTNVKAWGAFPGPQSNSAWPPEQKPQETYFSSLGGSFRSRIRELEANRQPRRFIASARQMDLGMRLIWERRR